jgi:AcrR family transcriptional regulator
MNDTLISSLHNKRSGTTDKGMERAHAIVEAARQIIAAEGYAGLSMRRVAADVGVSLSNVQHYFSSKDTLVEAVLLTTMNMFQEKIDQIAGSMAHAPRIVQFESTIDMFLRELSDPVTVALFFEIWAMATRNAFASNLMDKMLARERKAIYKLIQGLCPDITDEQTHLRAALIVAQIQGLLLFRLFNPEKKAELAGLEQLAKEAVLRLAMRPD